MQAHFAPVRIRKRRQHVNTCNVHVSMKQITLTNWCDGFLRLCVYHFNVFFFGYAWMNERTWYVRVYCVERRRSVLHSSEWMKSWQQKTKMTMLIIIIIIIKAHNECRVRHWHWMCWHTQHTILRDRQKHEQQQPKPKAHRSQSYEFINYANFYLSAPLMHNFIGHPMHYLHTIQLYDASLSAIHKEYSIRTMKSNRVYALARLHISRRFTYIYGGSDKNLFFYFHRIIWIYVRTSFHLLTFTRLTLQSRLSKERCVDKFKSIEMHWTVMRYALCIETHKLRSISREQFPFACKNKWFSIVSSGHSEVKWTPQIFWSPPATTYTRREIGGEMKIGNENSNEKKKQ